MNNRLIAVRNNEENFAQPDQMHAAAKMPSPRKLTRMNGSRESRLTESKNQSNGVQQHCPEAKQVYLSHRRYVHTLLMNEVAELEIESESEARKQKWNSFESILFLSDPAMQGEM
jgi:hypothetical protein